MGLNDQKSAEINDSGAKIKSIAESLINVQNDSFTHFGTCAYKYPQPLFPLALRTKRGKGQLCIMNVNLQFLQIKKALEVLKFIFK